MGLRDWVSEKVHHGCGLTWPDAIPSMGLRDWVSEKAADFLTAVRADVPSMGLRDWVSEKAPSCSEWNTRPVTFNGAPRLGLGEGLGPRA